MFDLKLICLLFQGQDCIPPIPPNLAKVGVTYWHWGNGVCCNYLICQILSDKYFGKQPDYFLSILVSVVSVLF